MPPSLALGLWLVLLLLLFRYDPGKDARCSPALWVPLIWMFIIASRLPAQWITGAGGVGSGSASFEDGNPIDRTIFFTLILIAAAVLISRSFRWGAFITSNRTLTAFVLFALLSALWSEFPLVAAKRWIRDLGNYLVVLVVLTDRRPQEAVAILLRRLCFVLISLSVVLIKYYPGIGVGWDNWTGVPGYCGVTTSKYILALICMVSGIYCFWDSARRWPDRKGIRTRRALLVNAAFIVMTLWVLNLANGRTCQVCMVVGWLVILAARSVIVTRYPASLTVLLPAAVCVALLLAFGLDFRAQVASAVGRDPTLTDRTELWSYLLGMKTNPILGAGYETFWLGHRLSELWANFRFRPNQAHNGYLEIYLNLGVVGLAIVLIYMVGSYRTICRQFTSAGSLTALRLALWTVLPICSVTTAVFFKGDLLWLTFLLVSITVPKYAPAGAGRQQRRHTLKRVRVPEWSDALSAGRTWE